MSFEEEKRLSSADASSSEAEAGRHMFRAGSSLPEDKIIQLRSQLCIIEHNGELYGVSPDVLLESFSELPLEALDSDHGTIPIASRIRAISALTHNAVPELITSIGPYNIVRYDGFFYVLPQSLGEVRWGEDDIATFPGVTTTRTLKDAQDRAKKKGGILDNVKETVAKWSVLAKPQTNSSQPSPPRLVSSLENYNIVQYGDWYYGLPQELGKIDLQDTDAIGVPGVVREHSREEAEKQIRLRRGHSATNLNRQRSQPRLLASLEDYNVIEYEGWFYGVPQALGEIDLSRTDVIEMPGVVRDETRLVVENEIREIVRARE
jgi:hypothetical protein